MASRWRLVCCFLYACRGDAAVKTTEFRATLNAQEFLGTYDVRIDVPAGYVGKVTDGANTAWLEAPGMPGLVIGTDMSAEPNATAGPCDLRLPFRSVPHAVRSHARLPDGFVVVCDESDEPGSLIVRYIHAGKSRLFCAAQLDDRDVKQADAMVARCKSMTVHGPHIDDVSPEVWDEATITDLDTDKQARVKLKIPIGYVKHVDGRSASWSVPRSMRRWPSISTTVAPRGRKDVPVPEGFMMKTEADTTSAARFIDLGSVTVMCLVRIHGSIERQITQLKEVCASMSAELAN